MCVLDFGSEEAASPTGSQTNLHYASNMYDNLSELGVKLLRCEESRYGLLNFLTNAISWSDSTNSLKATFKVSTVVKQLLADGNMSQEMANQTLISLLQGLQLHGQHDANQGSLLNCSVLIYQLLRPTNPQLPEILSMVPGINLDDLQKFDQKILNAAAPGKVEKSEC